MDCCSSVHAWRDQSTAQRMDTKSSELDHKWQRTEEHPTSVWCPWPALLVCDGVFQRRVWAEAQEGPWALHGALKSPVSSGMLSPWDREPPPLPEWGRGPRGPSWLSMLLTCPHFQTPECFTPPKHHVPKAWHCCCLHLPASWQDAPGEPSLDRGPQASRLPALPLASLLLTMVLPEGAGVGAVAEKGQHGPGHTERRFAEGLY